MICTAYSDYSWEDIASALGASDNVLILKKPFDSVEVLQLAHALTKKWHLGQAVRRQMAELDRIVNQRTAELKAANESLKTEAIERYAATAALRQSEERFSKAFRASPVPMAIEHLATGAFIDANAAFLGMTGHQVTELMGDTDAGRAIWADPATPAVLREHLAHGTLPRAFPALLRTKAGTQRDTLLFAEPVELGGEAYMLLIAQDITDQKRLEDQLRQAHKMEAVGQLAAGIAHDFNNILTVIIGNTSLQLRDKNLSETTADALNQVVRAAERATALTHQLLAYSRQQIIQRVPVNLNDQLARTTAMLRRVITEGIEITTDFAADLSPILAEPTNLDQVYMNLVLNARDAMPEGGKLSVATANVTVSEATAATRPDAAAGEFVRLSVRDTGHGMDAATRERIFEPFFTTKEEGRGTGMGLATSFGIVQQHGGWIDVRSEVGVGATFDVYFPRHAGALPERAAGFPGSAGTAPLAPEGTVLVVEDEDTLRVFVVDVLESFGYRVLSAANGQEALEIWEREKDQIVLLLTDIVLPESISGRQLAQQLQQDKRQLNVIYTSAHSAELVRSDSGADGDAKYLPKPYRSDRLAKLVSTCFAGDDA